MTARIYSPAKTAMQSGKAKTGRWVLEYDASSPRSIDPLTGYTSSTDMNSQLKLTFESQEDAVAYAERKGIAYRVENMQKRHVMKAAYSDNFAFRRQGTWTH